MTERVAMKLDRWIRRQGARRLRSGVWTRKWHRITDVTVEGFVYTKCGLFVARDDLKWDVATTAPLTRMIGQPQLCKRCDW